VNKQYFLQDATLLYNYFVFVQIITNLNFYINPL